MQLITLLWLSSAPILGAANVSNTTELSRDFTQERNDNDSLSAERIPHHNSQIASQLAERPPSGVRKMSDDEGEKFFLDYWHFIESSDAILSNSSEAFNPTSPADVDESSIALFVAQSYPFRAPSPPLFENDLQARSFKCPIGTWACTSIGRSDRCCGSGETCEIVHDTGHGNVGCCASGKTCNGMIGSCAYGYTVCSQALGGGCCIPGYHCVEGGCAYITVVTVTVHSTVVISTVTYSTIPQTSASSTTSSTSSQSSSTTTNDGLGPPARPTHHSTLTSETRGDDICPTGFYACSAVYHGGCCRTGRDCDTTSCPTILSTTLISDGVTILAPVATPTDGPVGNSCAKGWFHCADTVGGGCCPTGFACGSSCTATDISGTTVDKEQATSGDGVELRVSRMLILTVLGLWMI